MTDLRVEHQAKVDVLLVLQLFLEGMYVFAGN